MKLKNNVASLKLLPLAVCVSCVLVPLAAVLRFVQVYTLIDPATGFYTRSSPLTWIVNLLLLGGACCAALYCYFSKDTQALQPLEQKNVGLFVLALLYAVSLLINGLESFTGFSSAAAGYGLHSAKELMSTGALPLLFQGVFALLSGVYFIFVALSYKKGSALASKRRLLALAPTAWVAARLLHLFVRKISFMRVSDLFFELTACVFMILFFLAFAQTASGVYSTGMSWRLAGFGLAGALVTLGVQLPRFVLSFLEDGRFINENHPFLFSDLCFGFFAIALCFVMLRSLKAEKEPKAEATTEAPAAAASPFDDIEPINFGK